MLLLAFLLITTACGSAGNFAQDVGRIGTETVDLDTAAADGGDTSDAAAAAALGAATAPEPGATADPSSARDAQLPGDDGDGDPSADSGAEPETPVLEVTAPPAVAAQPDGQPGQSESAAESDVPAAVEAGQETDGSDQETGGSPPPATTAPATDSSSTQPPATAAPTTIQPPATDPPPPATEAPVATPPATAPPTGGEPDCSVLCNIAMEGDSLTVGLGSRLCDAVKTGNCINSGIVGRRVDEMIVTARSDVDNQVGPGDHDVLILWGGTNDLWQKFHSPDPATNAAAIYENIKTFVAERRAAGWDHVYVMTLPPMNPTYVVGTEPLNELIRRNEAGANGILDVGADPRLANAFDPAMRAPDGIHFGDGGRAVVMEYILGAVNNLDGR